MRLGSDWVRLHPLSPLLRGGRVLAVAAAVSADEITSHLLPRPALAGLLLPVALVVGAIAGWWSWSATGYRVTAEEVELRTGVLFRRHRRVPLARLESIDIARPLDARLFGLAQLRLEAVSDSRSELHLSYLDYTAAVGLAEELRARREEPATGTDGSDGASAVPPRRLVRVETRELLLGTVVGWLAAVWAAVLAITVTILLTVGPVAALVFAPLAASVPIVFGLAEAERLYGFTLGEGGGGLQISRGLFNEMHQRVPIDRIQAVAVVEPLMWRPFGRARLVVDVAGYRGGEQGERRRTSVLLPIAPLPVVAAVVPRVLPGLRLEALSHSRAPTASRWRAPLRWRTYSVAWTGQHAVMRRGLLQRRTDIVPHLKVQSLRVTQGPWQRALHLATLRLDTAGTEIRARAPHRGQEEAERLAWASREAANVDRSQSP